MLRLIELTAKVSGSQASMMRSKRRLVRIEIDLGRQLDPLGDLRPQRDAEAARGLQRIDHVKIVRPGLGEVLPGMRARIGGHEMLGPIRRRALRIVLLQGLRIVLALVAEDIAELLQERRARHQAGPIIMRDLMAEMTEQRAIGFAHLDGAAARAPDRRPPPD